MRNKVISGAVMAGALAISAWLSQPYPTSPGSGAVQLTPAGTACGPCYSGKCGCVNITLTPYNPFSPQPTRTSVGVPTLPPSATARPTITPRQSPTRRATATRIGAPTAIATATDAPDIATVTPLPTVTPFGLPTVVTPTPGPSPTRAPTDTPGPTLTPSPTPILTCDPGWAIQQQMIAGDVYQFSVSDSTPWTNIGFDISPSAPTQPTYISASPAWTWAFEWTAPTTPGAYTLTFTQNGVPVKQCMVGVTALDPTATPIPIASNTPTPTPTPVPTQTPWIIVVTATP